MDRMDAQTANNDKPTWSEFQNATYAALNCKAVTEQARKLTSTLCDQITETELRLEKRQHKRGAKKTEQLRTAVAGFIADLLRAQASGNGRHLNRL
jgi:hypothetical protein